MRLDPLLYLPLLILSVGLAVVLTFRIGAAQSDLETVNLERMNHAMGTAFTTMDDAEAEWRRRQTIPRVAEQLPPRFTILRSEKLQGAVTTTTNIVRDSANGECHVVIANGSSMTSWPATCQP